MPWPTLLSARAFCAELPIRIDLLTFSLQGQRFKGQQVDSDQQSCAQVCSRREDCTDLLFCSFALGSAGGMSRVTALEERIAQVRANRDALGWLSAKALLLGNKAEARDWAEMAAEDDEQVASLRRELRAQPGEPGRQARPDAKIPDDIRSVR